MAVDEECCFICLGSEEPLIKPCRCLTCHQTCLARWQLQSAGKEEESKCRFCKQTLPSWKAAFSDLSGEAAPVMSIQFNGHTYWLQVKSGEGGATQFKEDVRRLLGLTAEQAFDITFECRAPGAGSKMELQGLHTYDAAVYCASLSAARRGGGSKAGDGRRCSTGSSAASGLGGSFWRRNRSISSTGAASNSSSSDDAAAPAGSSSSSSEAGSSDHADAHVLARRSWAAGSYGGTASSSAFGGLCHLQAAAAHLLTGLRLLWQAPDDDIAALC
ncbi:hypothetical protein COO60DRAFT_1270392 [Scenedesmus sp. NREL 46B-D3]|nr:hypothetical protein COO60DRAFT_1270392 [Scenedesmus sp. NREL 46B-D3]